MATTLINAQDIKTVQSRANREMWRWWLWFISVLGLTGVSGFFMVRRGPDVSMIVWLLFLAGAAAILYRPRFGIYLLVFLTLVGDAFLLPWYPFFKNFSSRESLLFIHDSLIVNPLETYLLLTLVSWLVQGAVQRKLKFRSHELIWPALTFLGFVIFGLAYGLGTGGNANIGLWEARPLFYLVIMLLLASHLLTCRQHIANVIWIVMPALIIEAIVGAHFVLVELRGSLAGIDRIMEHAAAVHMNTIFVLVIGLWLYRSSWKKRVLLSSALPVVFLTYLASQRRAAFLSLGMAILLLFVVLYYENRRLFWLITPVCVLAGTVYLGAFWNSSGATGLPAQAVKSIVAPEQVSASDRSSNIYRQLEDINTTFTVRQHLLTGIGFGQKFYVIVPMADISFFEWWQYLSHNSIIWIWLKTGLGGFVAMLYFVGTAIMVGARVFMRMPRNELRAIALMATLYLVMHFMFAFVDISWDMQSMMYIGTMMGILASAERIVAGHVPVARRRWPWQPTPRTAPSLVPLSQ